MLTDEILKYSCNTYYRVVVIKIDYSLFTTELFTIQPLKSVKFTITLLKLSHTCLPCSSRTCSTIEVVASQEIDVINRARLQIPITDLVIRTRVSFANGDITGAVGRWHVAQAREVGNPTPLGTFCRIGG